MNRVIFGSATLVIGGHEYQVGSLNGSALTVDGDPVASNRIEWPVNGWSGSFEISGAINFGALRRLFGARTRRRPRRSGMRQIRRLKYWRPA
ncbi:hypothetical protein GCT13_08265 [Paraburkholderia sp. CNPSo 3157]|uniref:Uncharacterized protein n=1 Tax=Paraburkholderia franconis TaxID=2654983 RepID=A0A7X1N7Y9_9BURK|nr:hypothetical protein [Paraburkholderia franconis]MPW16924.1 hypothetical protein [Paraburkholderia franconis]